MPYTEIRNHRKQLHADKGPAVMSDDRKEWWVEGRRHRDDGPAVETIKGTKWFYWRGVRVPEHVIMDPRCKSPKEILKEPNAEVRRAWMEKYGLDDFILDLNPKVLDKDEAKEGMLLRVEIPNDEPLVMIRVKNSTPEGRWVDDKFYPELKDGKPYCKYYMIRVPPATKTFAEGVSWTFGMTEKEYKPAFES